MTRLLSASCGTHLGLTNAVASIALSPLAASRLISWTLASVGICAQASSVSVQRAM